MYEPFKRSVQKKRWVKAKQRTYNTPRVRAFFEQGKRVLFWRKKINSTESGLHLPPDRADVMRPVKLRNVDRARAPFALNGKVSDQQGVLMKGVSRRAEQAMWFPVAKGPRFTNNSNPFSSSNEKMCYSSVIRRGIRTRTTILDFSNHALRTMHSQQVRSYIENVPSNTIRLQLDLSNNYVAFTSEDKLKALFNAVPHTVKNLHVDLSKNYLSSANPKQLENIFYFLPTIPNILIDLSKNDLNFAGEAQLKIILTRLPKNVIGLMFSNNYLSLFKPTYLKMIEKIPPHVRSLDLSNNNLNAADITTLQTLFASIPETVTDLHLANNGLNHLSAKQLYIMFSSIHGKIRQMHLQDNALHIMRASQLEAIFENLPTHLSYLSLCCNDLHATTPEQWEVILQSIPKDIHDLNLNLSRNDLYRATAKQLGSMLRNVPPNVTYLNLSYNVLHFANFEQWKAITQNIPHTLQKISFRHNGIQCDNLKAVIQYVSNDLKTGLNFSQNKLGCHFYGRQSDPSIYKISSNNQCLWKFSLSNDRAYRSISEIKAALVPQPRKKRGHPGRPHLMAR